jgi:site-specific recombinase XerC
MRINEVDREAIAVAIRQAGSSPKTDRNLVGLLQSIFSLAVDNDLIPRSPVLDRHRSFFQCAMLTGARLGELLGLQWKNINFDSQALEIRQALWEGEFVSPKSGVNLCSSSA